MSLKKDTLGNASKSSLSEAMRCSECLHYKNLPHRGKDDICSNLGVRTFAIAPKCFTPNVTRLFSNSAEFVQLAGLLSSYTPAQKRLLLALLRNTPKGKRYPFGTKLYLKTGREYLSNYLCGYVAGYTASGELILTGSPDVKTQGKSFFAYLKSSADLLDFKAWKIKRAQLVQAGKFIDPARKIKGITARQVQDANYEIPTIETEFQQAKAKTRRTRVDLVEQFTF